MNPPPKKRWQPTYAAAELQSALPLTDPDFQMKQPFLPAREKGEKRGRRQCRRAVYLPSCAFPWTPQQRLRVQPGLFCCTQSPPQSPLWWGCWSSWCWGTGRYSLETLLSYSEETILEQMIPSVPAMQLLALRIYFMTAWLGLCLIA